MKTFRINGHERAQRAHRGDPVAAAVRPWTARAKDPRSYERGYMREIGNKIASASAFPNGVWERGNLRKRGGFTLLEMMISLAIFVLLVAAVFSIMTGTLQGTATLQDNQSRRDQISALNAYLNKKLCEMPARSSLITYTRGDGEGLVQNGIIFGNTNFATALDAKVQANGYYTLRLTTFSTAAGPNDPPDARNYLQTAASSDDPTLVWTTLITDFKTLDWKFLDNNATVWVEIWSSSTKPNLVELSAQLAGDLQPTVMDFWLPKIDTISLNAASRAATP